MNFKINYFEDRLNLMILFIFIHMIGSKSHVTDAILNKYLSKTYTLEHMLQVCYYKIYFNFLHLLKFHFK